MKKSDIKGYGNSLAALYRKHPILSNILFIILAAVVLGWLLMLFLDVWTIHGENRTVPDVKGLNFPAASEVLKKAGFSVEISDSIFDEKAPAGNVVEQWPKEGAKVKPGRLVYLKINSFYPRTVTITDALTDISSRQAESYLESLGIKDIRIIEVPGEYDDLVMGAKFNGVPLRIGSKIPVTATVTIEVSRSYHDPYEDINEDSLLLAIDSMSSPIFHEPF